MSEDLSGARKVLVVDDSPLAADALALLFRVDGRFEVIGPARSIEEASEFADQADAVVLDLNLREASGPVVVQKMMEFTDAPIIVHTADCNLMPEPPEEGVAATVLKGDNDALLEVLTHLTGG
jgi:chemotaxis response regulator CheB